MKDIVKEFMTFRNQMKMYHWKTAFYSRHKTSDKFLELMDEHIDKFVEVLSGSRNMRVTEDFSIKFVSLNDKNIMEYLEKFREWLLSSLPELLYDHEVDLFNIRDEIVADVNRVLYLFRLK
jgi:DNA-binding ferritin-like protein